jgi:hypothetical protein
MTDETTSEEQVPRESAMFEAFQINYGDSPDHTLLGQLVTEMRGKVEHETHDSVVISLPEANAHEAKELMARYCEADVKATMSWIRRRTIDKLRAELTDAIWKLDEHHAKLADLHEQLANLLPPDSFEGDNARRYAIFNARMARLDDYVDALMEKFLSEDGATEHLRRWALGDNWRESCHQRCVSAAADLQDIMATTDDEERATRLAFAVLVVRDAAKLIEWWERATAEHPPHELREVATAVNTAIDTLLEREEDADPIELMANLVDMQADVRDLLGETTRWVSFHSNVATQNAIAARRFEREVRAAEQRNEELTRVLEAVMAAGSLEEVQLLAARELAVTGQVDPEEEGEPC